MSAVRDVAAFVGSLRKESINRKLAKALAELAPSSLKLEIVEIGQLPLYNQDDDQNPPQAYTEFRARVNAADAVIFVTPEYNRTVPGIEKRLGRGLAAIWPERLERQTRRRDQRLAQCHRRIRCEPVTGVLERARDAAAGGLSRRHGQAL